MDSAEKLLIYDHKNKNARMKILIICFVYAQKLCVDDKGLNETEDYTKDTLFETLNFSEMCEFLVRYAFKCELPIP